MSYPSLSPRNVSPRIFGLDLLRAVAILLVLRGHGNSLLLRPKGLTFFDVVKWPDSVDLFFVLSGFLIGGILLRMFETRQVSFRLLLTFWKFRWFRTLPNYYLTLGIALVVHYFLHGGLMGFRPSYLLFMQNLAWPHPPFFGMAWSLSVEEWFYLLFPLLLCCISLLLPWMSFPRKFLFTVFTFMATAVITRFLFLSPYLLDPGLSAEAAGFEVDAGLRKIVVYRLDAIAFGCLGAYVSHRHPGFWMRMRWPGSALGILLLSVYLLVEKPQVTMWSNVFFNSSLLLSVLCFMPMLSSIRRAPLWLSRPVTSLSVTSYSMYLVHLGIVLPLTQRIFDDHGGTAWVIGSFLFYLFSTYVLSLFLYRFFEKPMTDLRKRSFFGWTGPATK